MFSLYASYIIFRFVLKPSWIIFYFYKSQGVHAPAGYLPIFGHRLVMKKSRDLYKSLFKLFQKEVKDVGFSVFTIGQETYAVVGNPHYYQEILSQKDCYDKSRKLVAFMDQLTGTISNMYSKRGLFMQAATHVQSSQQKIAITKVLNKLHFNISESIFCSMKEEFESVFESLTDEQRLNGKPANYMMKPLAKIIWQMIFGKEIEFPDKIKALNKEGKIIVADLGTVMWISLDLLADSYFLNSQFGEQIRQNELFNADQRAIHFNFTNIRDIFALRLKEKIVLFNQEGKQQQTDIFGNLLVQLKQQGLEMSFVEMYSLLHITFVAAFDSQIAFMMALMACLADFPQKQDILRADIIKNFKEDDYKSVNDIEYLDITLAEILRMSNPFRFPPEVELSKDFQIGKYTLHKSTIVYLDTGYMMNDPEVWDEPQNFEPERFLRNSNLAGKKRPLLSYTPFFSGPRACPAENIMRYFSKVMFSRFLLSNYVQKKAGQTGRIPLYSYGFYESQEISVLKAPSNN